MLTCDGWCGYDLTPRPTVVSGHSVSMNDADEIARGLGVLVRVRRLAECMGGPTGIIYRYFM